MKGKSFLDQTGIADPTGCGLGFSFLRVSAKPQKVAKEEVDKEAPKKLVTGTNADLRKLPLKEARQMCREFGLLEEEISQLERWFDFLIFLFCNRIEGWNRRIEDFSVQKTNNPTCKDGCAYFCRPLFVNF